VVFAQPICSVFGAAGLDLLQPCLINLYQGFNRAYIGAAATAAAAAAAASHSASVPLPIAWQLLQRAQLRNWWSYSTALPAVTLSQLND
jgi:hypothetical protein